MAAAKPRVRCVPRCRAASCSIRRSFAADVLPRGGGAASAITGVTETGRCSFRPVGRVRRWASARARSRSRCRRAHVFGVPVLSCGTWVVMQSDTTTKKRQTRAHDDTTPHACLRKQGTAAATARRRHQPITHTHTHTGSQELDCNRLLHAPVWHLRANLPQHLAVLGLGAQYFGGVDESN